MPGKGKQFDSTSGALAARRKRGLKAWRTRLEREGPIYLSEHNKLISSYARSMQKLSAALKALASGDHGSANRNPCHCPFHTAYLYSYDPTFIRQVVAQKRAELDIAVRQLKREWAKRKHDEAMAGAAPQRDDGW